MSKNISIIGAGGLGREIKLLVDEINSVQETWTIDGFYDDNFENGALINGVPVLGKIEDLQYSKCKNCVIAIGDPNILKILSEKFLAIGKFFPNIVHPLASLGSDESNNIGYGNIFTYGFYMTTNVKLQNFNIFNTRVTLGHDVMIGSCNVFFPNAQISGHVTIGDKNIFGMNSSVLSKKSIGSNNKIGAHSLVVSNLNSGMNVFGSPAKKL